MTDYEVYDAEATRDVDEDGHWQVLVECFDLGTNNYGSPRPMLRIAERNLSSKDRALTEARRVAFEYDPPDPWRVKRRRVFRSGEEFFVEAEGVTQTVPFRVFVAQYLGSRDR